MPIVIEDLSGLGKGIESFGSSMATGLEKRAERRLKDKEEDKKKESFNSLLVSMESQGGEAGALASALKQAGVTPEMALPFLKSSF